MSQQPQCTPTRKLLIQLSGPPGSGKSTLATHLSRALPAIIVNHDTLKTFFLSTSHDWTNATQLTYELQWVLARDFLTQNHSVIMDSTCNYPRVRDTGIALAAEHDALYVYVECRVSLDDLELLDERIKQRDGMRSQRRGVWEPPVDAERDSIGEEEGKELFRRWIEEPCRPEDERRTVVVETGGALTPEECCAYVMSEIGKWSG
ncbi:hypothetical protein BT63DRAFT_427037 [Microthyrium microscopicum]|uniref:P-loop containing nucleoside triphosphate hydrolase protein n=1 Tax=Microthyrium microscopicum TaxID=703497 RepID=A0A6A6U4N2_9PEZI|nr:hypothetical protein BT63DRAFT_427037 [Microthyrium microscopicum]